MKRAIVAILLTACLAGCNSGKRIAKANDALRLERETLKEQVAALENENAELKSKNSELNNRLESPIPEDVLAALPRIASIELSRFCSVWTEGGASEARFFIVPKDGRGRFVQAVGKVGVSVTEYEAQTKPLDQEYLARNEHIEPIGRKTLSALELRDSFVSGLSGNSYMINVPLTKSPSGSLLFTVWLEDAITGEFFSEGRLIKVSE